MGFIKGGLWLVCWIGAIFATLYGYPYVEPVASTWLKERGIITYDLVADIAIGTTIFLISVIFLFAVSSVLSGWVRESRLNVLDRSLGFVAGLAVAVGIVSTVYIPFSSSWSDPDEQPSWFRDAELKPAIQWGAEVVRTILPERFGGNGPVAGAEVSANRTAESERAYQTLANPRPEAGGSKDGTGYNSGARKDMDRLFETTRDR